MTKTRTFTVDELFDLGIPHDSSHVVADWVSDVGGRWLDLHTVVFNHEGQLWSVDYHQGKTESQWCEPWEYLSDPVTATLVEAYEETVTRYRPVADD